MQQIMHSSCSSASCARSEPGCASVLFRFRRYSASICAVLGQTAVDEWGDKDVLWHCERSDGARVFLGDSYDRYHVSSPNKSPNDSFPACVKSLMRLRWPFCAGATSSHSMIATNSFCAS